MKTKSAVDNLQSNNIKLQIFEANQTGILGMKNIYRHRFYIGNCFAMFSRLIAKPTLWFYDQSIVRCTVSAKHTGSTIYIRQ